MTRDDIIRMAHESGLLDEQHYGSMWADKIERFAALVAARERVRAEALIDNADFWDDLYDQMIANGLPRTEQTANVAGAVVATAILALRRKRADADATT